MSTLLDEANRRIFRDLRAEELLHGLEVVAESDGFARFDLGDGRSLQVRHLCESRYKSGHPPRAAILHYYISGISAWKGRQIERKEALALLKEETP